MKIKFEELTTEPIRVSCGGAVGLASINCYGVAVVKWHKPLYAHEYCYDQELFDAHPFERVREPRVLPFDEWIKLREPGVWWKVSHINAKIAWLEYGKDWIWENSCPVLLDAALVSTTFTEVIE